MILNEVHIYRSRDWSAAIQENLFITLANTKGTVQPVHMDSLVSANILKSICITATLITSEFSGFWVVSEQAGLSLTMVISSKQVF